jgi:gliding motility-associated-like protein
MEKQKNPLIREELKEIAPRLASMKAGKAFDVPDAYFDQLESSILEKAAAHTILPTRRILPYRRILAYAASMLLFTSLAWAAYQYVIHPAITRAKNEIVQPENGVPQGSGKQEITQPSIPESSAIDPSPAQEVNSGTASSSGAAPSIIDQQTMGQSGTGDHRPPSGPPAVTSSTIPAADFMKLRNSDICQGEAAIIDVAALESAISYRLLIDGHTYANWNTAGRYSVKSEYLSAGEHRIELLAFDKSGVVLQRHSASLRVHAMPVVDLGPDACYNGAQLLVTELSRNTDIRWQDGSRSANLLARQSGKYWVTLSNKDLPRCQTSDTVKLKILPPPANQVPDQITICNGEEIRLSPRDTRSGYEFRWQPGNRIGSTLFIQGLKPGTYDYTLEIAACEQNYTENVRVIVDNCGISIPNVITPNGDGSNDRFVISNLERYPQSYLAIFDRSGNKVFESNDYQNNWDADNCQNGTYYYILKMRKGPLSERSGTLTIVR